jgi:hypothetical protein
MALTTVSPGLLDSNAQYYSFKNRIINGGMGIWQRGTSFTGINNVPTYAVDRWAGFVSAVVAGEQIVQSASVPSGTGFLYSAAFGRTASNTNTNSIWFNQLIESNNMRDLAGQTVTLSFWAKTGANYSGGAMTVRVASGTSADQSIATYSAGPATGYTGYAAVINTTQSLTTTWTQYSFTGTVGSTALELAVSFAYTPTGTAGADDNIYITGVQLEKGSTATSFDYRPYGTEFDLCRRYCEVYSGSGDADGIPQFAGAVDVNNRPEIFVTYYPKRGTPSITVTNAATAFQITTMANTVLATTAYNGTSVGTGLNSSDLFWTVASGMTTNTLSGIGVLSFKASAKIIIDSEL